MRVHAEDLLPSGSKRTEGQQPATCNSMSAKDVNRAEEMKAIVQQPSSSYRHCSLRDAVTPDHPMENLDWYIVLIAAQASKTVYGDARECSRLPNDSEEDCFFDIAPVEGVQVPPIASLNHEMMSSIEDLCELLYVNQPTRNLFLDSSNSDLQIWFCEMPASLKTILSHSVPDRNRTAASRLVQSIIRESTNADMETGPQIIIAFRGHRCAADALFDSNESTLPLTWAGKFGAQMASDHAKLTPRDMADIIRRSHEGGRSALSAACRALLPDERSAAALGSLLRASAARAGVLGAYHSARQQLLRLLDAPACCGRPAGNLRPSLLLCGHGAGGALARLCALDLVACGRVPPADLSLVTFGASPAGNRALCKLLDLLHPRRDLHVVHHADPVPAAPLACADGGPGCLAAAGRPGGPLSHSGSKVWLQREEGALFERPSSRPPGRCGGAGSCGGAGWCGGGELGPRVGGRCGACCRPHAAGDLPQHYLAAYIRQCAALALRAGVPVLATFPGSASNPPPPGWARALLAAERRARRASVRGELP